MDFLTPRTRAGPLGTVIITGATKAYLQTSFKACNSITGIVGTSMCVYSLCRMIGACIRDRVLILPWSVTLLFILLASFRPTSPALSSLFSVLGFLYWLLVHEPKKYRFVGAFLGLGIGLCALACIGHAASVTRSSICLSFYIVLMLFLLLLETLIIGDVLLNDNWEEDIPDDPTGRLDDFLGYMESNIGLFRRVGLLVAVSQAMSLLLAMILRTECHKERGGDLDQPSTTGTIPFLDHPVLWPPTNAAASSPSFVSNKWIEY